MALRTPGSRVSPPRSRHLRPFLILLVALLAGPLAPSRAPGGISSHPFLRGDVEPDGQLALGDPLRILGFLFHGQPLSCASSADFDDDGRIEIADALGLLGHLFLGQAAPPPPYPGCGIDPTPDELGCRLHPRCSATEAPSGRMTYGLGALTTAHYSSDGRRLVLGSETGRITVLDTETFGVLHVLDELDERVVELDLERPGTRGIAGDVGGGVLIFDFETGAPIARREVDFEILALAVLSKRGEALVGGIETEILQLDLSSGDTIRPIDITADGTRLNSRTLDLQTVEESELVFAVFRENSYAWLDPAGGIVQPRFGPGLVFGYLGLFVDATTGGRIGASDYTFFSVEAGSRHTEELLRVPDDIPRLDGLLGTDPEGHLLLEVGTSLQVRTWPGLTEIRRLDVHDREIDAMALSPDSTRLFTASPAGLAYQHHYPGLVREHVAHSHEAGARRVAMSPDGALVATGGTTGEIRMRDAREGRLLLTLRGHEAAITELEFDPTGRHLASSSLDGTWRLWNLETAREITHYRHGPDLTRDGITTFRWSPSTHRVFAGTTGGEVFALDNRDLTLPPVLLAVHERAIVELALDGEGPRLFSGSVDGVVKVGDTQSREAARVLLEGPEGLASLSLAPDDSELLVTSRDGTIDPRDPQTGERRSSELSLSETALGAARHVPGTRWIVAGEVEGRVHFLDREEPARSLEVPATCGQILDLRVAPGGVGVLVAGSDGTAQLLPLPPAD